MLRSPSCGISHDQSKSTTPAASPPPCRDPCRPARAPSARSAPPAPPPRERRVVPRHRHVARARLVGVGRRLLERRMKSASAKIPERRAASVASCPRSTRATACIGPTAVLRRLVRRRRLTTSPAARGTPRTARRRHRLARTLPRRPPASGSGSGSPARRDRRTAAPRSSAASAGPRPSAPPAARAPRPGWPTAGDRSRPEPLDRRARLDADRHQRRPDQHRRRVAGPQDHRRLAAGQQRRDRRLDAVALDRPGQPARQPHADPRRPPTRPARTPRRACPANAAGRCAPGPSPTRNRGSHVDHAGLLPRTDVTDIEDRPPERDDDLGERDWRGGWAGRRSQDLGRLTRPKVPDRRSCARACRTPSPP
jgi:hypothetical protein